MDVSYSDPGEVSADVLSHNGMTTEQKKKIECFHNKEMTSIWREIFGDHKYAQFNVCIYQLK